MNDAPAEPPRWSRLRWWALIALVFAGQIGFVFLLGGRTPTEPRPPAIAPALHLAGRAAAEWLALSDQTLFVLPHEQGFSGLAWFSIAPPAAQRVEWSETPEWLPLPVRQLGGDFNQFIMTNRLLVAPSPSAHPLLTLPEVPGSTLPLKASNWRIEGALAARKLASSFNLPPWQHSDVVTNTVIQLLVNADGVPVSATLMPGSGFAAADQFALEQSRAARFEPLAKAGPGRDANPAHGLTWGTIVFEWQTLPPLSTNTVSLPAPPP